MNEGTQRGTEQHALLVEIRDNTRSMALKLFGNADPDKENHTGRLPVIEKRLEIYSNRIAAVEKQSNRIWERLVTGGAIILYLADHFILRHAGH